MKNLERAISGLVNNYIGNIMPEKYNTYELELLGINSEVVVMKCKDELKKLSEFLYSDGRIDLTPQGIKESNLAPTHQSFDDWWSF
jgi:hypothetical protein